MARKLPGSVKAQSDSPTQPCTKKGVVSAVVYSAEGKVADIKVGQAGEWATKPGHLVWIGLYEPDDKLLKEVQKQFCLHPLAIEDASKAHQRTKLEQYGDSLFIVARTAHLIKKRVAVDETHLFVGKGYVVTIRHGASPSYAPVRARYEALPRPLKEREEFIVYSLLDFIVDNYSPLIEIVHAEVEDIEDKVLLSPLPQAEVERLYHLRRDLLRLRNAVAPMVDVCRGLEHGEILPMRVSMQELFRDVTDHVRRMQEEIETLRQVLAFAFEANMMVGQAQQGSVTRNLASWAAILAVPTAIAGIYGMNFKYMPEIDWQYGYFAVLALMFGICTTLYFSFKRNGWL